MLKRTLVLYALVIISAAVHLRGDDCRPGFEFAQKITNGPIASAAWGDFDGDGRSDVAVTTAGSRLSVLMNRGNGVFQNVSSQAFTDPLYGSDDVNGDGRPDLIVLSPVTTAIGVALGQGNGTFGPLIFSPIASGDFRRLADINGDGFKDLVVFDRGRVFVHLSQKDGHFAAAAQIISMPLFQSYQFAVADFDGDGYNDVYAAGVSTETGHPFNQYIWWNDRKGSFPTDAEVSMSELSAPAEMLDACNFGGTGTPGILLRDQQTGAKQLLTAKNRTIVTRPVDVASAIQNEGTTELTGFGDFDGDGNRDALFADGTVVWGGGTAQRIDGSRFDLLTDTGVHVADINGDGIADLAGTGVFAIQGKPHSRKLAGGSVTAAAAQSSASASGDVNGDGIADVVIDSVFNHALLSTYLGDGHGGFVPAATQLFPALTTGPFTLADFDKDGKVDLLDGIPSVSFGDGAGHFGSTVAFPGTHVAGAGRVDSSGTMGAFLSTDTALQLVTFSGRTPSSSQILSTLPNTYVVPADVDGDGIVDLVVDDNLTIYVQIYKKTGTAWTATAQLTGLSRPVSRVVAADFDGDGRRDLVTCSDSGCNLSLATAGGYAAPTQPVNYPNFAGVKAIRSADVDGDGRPDLIALASSNSGAVLVARNSGGGTFERPQAVYVGGTDIFAIDTDSDGLPELVAVHAKGLIVIHNGCAQPAIRLAVLPAAVYAGDRPVLLVNLENTNGLGPVTLREGSTVIATQTTTTEFPIDAVSFTLPALTAGPHTFTVTYTETDLGTAEATITVNATPPVPRKRAVHH